MAQERAAELRYISRTLLLTETDVPALRQR
jgi:hypothetical protein